METTTERAALIQQLVADTARDWQRQAPASADAIATLQAEAGWELPADYIAFLQVSNGGDGDLGAQPGWFQLWEAEAVMANNDGYNVAEAYAPYFGIGGNGGGEMLCFNRDERAPHRVYSLPFIGDLSDALLVAGDFRAFIRLMGIEWKG